MSAPDIMAVVCLVLAIALVLRARRRRAEREWRCDDYPFEVVPDRWPGPDDEWIGP